MDNKESWRAHTESESECEIKNPLQNFNLKQYLEEEVWQHSRRRNEARNFRDLSSGTFRNRVWKFLSIPYYFESFMSYGLLQCLDHLLMVYTFLPLRCVLLFGYFLSFVFYGIIGFFVPSMRPGKVALCATDVREVIKFSFVCICTVFLYTFDSSIAYHEIRTQSVIKIYIFFNLLEVADRLLSAVYLDAVDDVLYTISARFSGSSRQRSPSGNSSSPAEPIDSVGIGAFVAQYLFALVCLSAHSLLLLAQVTTLNVAFNSQNRSLLTVMISNNFVELKGNVFRKMGKSNLFQIACADVRERFHYTVWLFIIVCRNMSASGWQYDDFLGFVPDILLIFLSELGVDWVKHAFITKFNVISSKVYREYTVSIAYDLLSCRQGKNTSDYFEHLARRMGLTPISLSCLINVMLIQTVKSSWIYALLPLVIPLLFALKVLVHIVLLGRAYAHVSDYTQLMLAKQLPASSLAAGTTATSASTKAHTSVDPMAGVSSSKGDVVSKPGGGVGDVQRKANIFSPPFSGYDQPTRDEGQLAMPQLPLLLPRRSHSDVTGISAMLTATEVPEQDEEEYCSLQNFPIDQQPQQPPKKILKLPQPDKDVRFRRFLLDVDDEMQVTQRKRPILLPSLSNPSTLDSVGHSGLSPISPNSFGEGCFLPSFMTSNPLLTSSPKTSPAQPTQNDLRRRILQRLSRRRRCFSLNDVVLHLAQTASSLTIQITATPASLHDEGDEQNLEKSHQQKKHIRFVPPRRRLHTENEISSMLILEQLSSLLNDEKAHLVDAVDVDMLSDEEAAAKEPEDEVPSKSVGGGDEARSGSQGPSGAMEAESSTLETSVKQPLSNVDRYSMLGGQII